MEIKTILVPTDFSDFAAHAYNWALGLAVDCKAKIVLFHATPTMSHIAFPESVYYPDLARMEGELIADAEKRVGEFAAKKGTSTVPGNRTPGANATEPRAEEKSAVGARALGFCRLPPSRPSSNSPTHRGVVGGA